MKLTLRTSPLLLAGLWLPVCAAQGSWMQLSDQRRNELRGAVETHRASQREEVRREETVAGRRLTAAELAELREQVRQQWAPRSEQVHTAPLPVEDRGTATAHGTLVPAARLQRP